MKSNAQLLRDSLASLKPTMLNLSDHSAAHGEPSDSHFSLYIVSAAFEGKGAVERTRIVNRALKEQGVFDRIHALKLTPRTPEEHERETANPLK